jgi:hypothetical protein
MIHSNAHSIIMMPTMKPREPATATPRPAQANTNPLQSPSPIPVLVQGERSDQFRGDSLQVTVDSSILHKLLAHASSAARLVSYLDDRSDPALVVVSLADNVDAIVHELCELLGSARTFPCLVQRTGRMLGDSADSGRSVSVCPEVRPATDREPTAASGRSDATGGVDAVLVALILLGAIDFVPSGDIP